VREALQRMHTEGWVDLRRYTATSSRCGQQKSARI
jgi:DNA-binding FadR family transcriptional regulator